MSLHETAAKFRARRTPPDDALYMKDLAGILGLTYPTVRQYRHRGILPAEDGVDSGSPWWKPDTITEWMEGQF